MEPPMWFQMIFYSAMMFLIFTLTVAMWVTGAKELMDRRKGKGKR